ncbi:MAG: IS630 family transposase [Acidobacteriales bacterium]|nr:IS630 family transposase [Terriglobales bacterium]
MFTPATALSIDPNQQKRLEHLVRSGKTSQKIVLRARIVLLATQGTANHAIAQQLDTSRPTVLLWRRRFEQSGVPGLMRDAKRPGRKPALSAEKVKAVVEATLHTTPANATHWSVRSMAKAQGLSRMAVQRIWKAHKLQPHRVQTFKLSRDPQFVEKVREVVGLYLNPPDKALVLSVDEKSQIQALDRTAPLLPLRPGIPARQSHDYKRHGTTTLFAALSLLDGKVIGECLPRHRSREFIRFLGKIDQETPAELDLHLIVDNYSTHKSPPVKRWLKRHPRFHLHFIPTSSSWLNVVERWFGEITRKRIRRGTFKSVPELIAAIESYLNEHNQNPTKFVWTKDAETILAKVNRCKEALGTPH